MRDAQLAQSQSLLTAAEPAELGALAGSAAAAYRRAAGAARSAHRQGRARPLQSLLMVIGEQIAAVAYDLDQLYDDQFIETCAAWVIPYIGDLIGYQSIKGHRRSGRQSARRGGQYHFAPPPQGHRAGDGAARARRYRLGRARGGVFPRAGRHAVHEPYPPRQLLRPRSAPLGARPIHRHRLRPHRASQSTCAASRPGAGATTSRTSASFSGR